MRLADFLSSLPKSDVRKMAEGLRDFSRPEPPPEIVPSSFVPRGMMWETWAEPFNGPVTHLDKDGHPRRKKVLTRYVNDEDYRAAVLALHPSPPERT